MQHPPQGPGWGPPPGAPLSGPFNPGPPPAPPRKGSNTALVVLLVLGSVVALGFGGCVVCVLLAPEPTPTPVSAELQAKLGPCADLSIDSVGDAFDKDKLGKCSSCCEQKAPGHTAAYYHFEGNKPPGLCRCVSGSAGGPDCVASKDLGECLACCSKKKKGAKFAKGGGCTCE